MVSGGEGGGMARTPRIHPAYRSYFLGSVVLSSHSPPVTPFRAHFVHSPLRAVGEWNETEDVSGVPRLSHPHISLQLLPFTFGSVRKE